MQFGTSAIGNKGNSANGFYNIDGYIGWGVPSYVNHQVPK